MTLPGIIIALSIRFIFYLSLSSLLSKIRKSNRELGQTAIWASFVPLIWAIMFPYVISKLSVSLIFELSDLKMKTKSKSPTLAIGIVYYIFTLIGGVFMLLSYIYHEDVCALLGLLCSAIGIIFFIVYWILIGKYNRILNKNLPGNQI